MGLLGRELDVVYARFRLLGHARRRQCRTFRQGLGDLRGNGLRLAAAEVADQRDDRVAGGVGLLVEGAQLGDADLRHGMLVAVAGVGVGMLAVETLEQLDAGQFAGVLLLVFEGRQHLIADARQGLLGEARLADHLLEQLQRCRALVGITQAAQAGDRHVAVGTVAEVGAEAFETAGDGGGVLARHAFVEHRVGQHGQAGVVAVLAAAGGEGQAQVEHRQLVGLDEQHAGAFGGLPLLDVQLAVADRLVGDFRQGLQRRSGRFARRRRSNRGSIADCGGTTDEEDQASHQQDDDQAEQTKTQAVALTHDSAPCRRWLAAIRGRGSSASG
ncbi:hypothetical protein D3C78_804860 [compost metagenome]